MMSRTFNSHLRLSMPFSAVIPTEGPMGPSGGIYSTRFRLRLRLCRDKSLAQDKPGGGGQHPTAHPTDPSARSLRSLGRDDIKACHSERGRRPSRGICSARFRLRSSSYAGTSRSLRTSLGGGVALTPSTPHTLNPMIAVGGHSIAIAIPIAIATGYRNRDRRGTRLAYTV